MSDSKTLIPHPNHPMLVARKASDPNAAQLPSHSLAVSNPIDRMHQLPERSLRPNLTMSDFIYIRAKK